MCLSVCSCVMAECMQYSCNSNSDCGIDSLFQGFSLLNGLWPALVCYDPGIKFVSAPKLLPEYGACILP